MSPDNPGRANFPTFGRFATWVLVSGGELYNKISCFGKLYCTGLQEYTVRVMIWNPYFECKALQFRSGEPQFPITSFISHWLRVSRGKVDRFYAANEGEYRDKDVQVRHECVKAP